MITPKFFAEKSMGKSPNSVNILILPDEVERMNQHVSQFKDGQELEITIKKKYKKRTQGAPGEETDFNGYYWGVIVKMVCDDTGDIDSERIHWWLQLKTGHCENILGEKIPKGTKDLSGAEFSEYCSKCRVFASEFLGLYIPEPHEVSF